MLETNQRQRKLEALEELTSLLEEAEAELVLVEGKRDEAALRALGFRGRMEVSSHVREIPHDTANRLAQQARRVLILTDFDREGSSMAGRLSKLLEGESVVVDRGLRRRIGSVMGVLGVKTVESLDDIAEAEARNVRV